MKKIFMIFAALAVLIMSGSFSRAASKVDIEGAITDGIDWLLTQQDVTNGDWGNDVAITSFVVIALCNHGIKEDFEYGGRYPVQQAVDWLLDPGNMHAGGIYNDDEHPNYQTSMAILALFATENPDYYDEINTAKEWLYVRQWELNEQCFFPHPSGGNVDICDPLGLHVCQACPGGFGYGDWVPVPPAEGEDCFTNHTIHRPDLSNTQFALMALSIDNEAEGLPVPIPPAEVIYPNIWSSAQNFVKACQNIEGLNYFFCGDYVTGGDGGLIYQTCRSAMDAWVPDPSDEIHCYSTGSMTAAGIWSYRLCDLPTTGDEGEPVDRALKWIEANEDCAFDDQPVAPEAGVPIPVEYQRKYYYYYTLAKALAMCGRTTLGDCDWYNQLSSKICYNQEDNGSWYSIEYNSSLPVQNRLLATAYAILTLQYKIPPPEDLWISILVDWSGKGSDKLRFSSVDLHVFDSVGNHVGRNFVNPSLFDDDINETTFDFDNTWQKVILNDDVILSDDPPNDVGLNKGTYRVEVFSLDYSYNITFNVHRGKETAPINSKTVEIVASGDGKYKMQAWDVTLASAFSELDALPVGPFEVPGVYYAERVDDKIILMWHPAAGAHTYRIRYCCESNPPADEVDSFLVYEGMPGLEKLYNGDYKYTLSLDDLDPCGTYHLFIAAVPPTGQTAYSHEIIPKTAFLGGGFGDPDPLDPDPGRMFDVPLYVDIPDWLKYLGHPADMRAMKLLLKFPKPLVIIGIPEPEPDPPPGPIPHWLEECGWEYINYRIGAPPDCNVGCPSEFLTFVAIADMNDGPNHPTCFMPEEPGRYQLFNVRLYVPNDWTLECQYLPMEFYWYDCGDNTFSSATGDTLFIAQRVFNSAGNLIWDENDDINFPEENRLPNVGAPDYCLNPDPAKPSAIRFIDFFDGGVKIACADSIDDRGDINLNGAAYEIADAVVFTNYFIYGLAAFTINQDGQIAATDVNADGMVLSVADLTYLIRVIIGDAVPYPKIAPVTAKYDIRDGILSVDQEMGAAYVAIKGNASPVNLTDNMEMKYAYDSENDMTKVLLYSVEKDHIFKGEFLELGGTLIEIEMATYDGAAVKLITDLLPAEFVLHQNKPNPFNPITDLSFSLPVASDVILEIYNITGQKVATAVEDRFDAGTHTVRWDGSNYASGVYMYRITAGEFTDSKKMLLLK